MLLIVSRMIYLSENWNNFHCREAFLRSKLTFFCFVCLIIYQTSWNFAIDKVDEKNVTGMFRHGIFKLVLRVSSDVSDQVFSGRWVRRHFRHVCLFVFSKLPDENRKLSKLCIHTHEWMIPLKVNYERWRGEMWTPQTWVMIMCYGQIMLHIWGLL